VRATRGGTARCRARARRAGVAAGALAALGLAAGGAGAAERTDDLTVSGFAFGGTGETVFEHAYASLRDPHFGMRFYLDSKVPGTLSPVSDPASADANARAAAKGGRHLFWDASFGERAPLVGWYDVHPTRSVRHARGVQVNLEAAAFLLLDFNAQSKAVIDTDYRLGGSLDLRPWVDGLDRLSLSLGFYHQSSHLGDEYVLSAHTIQAAAPPEVNPYLPYRANPSYYALPGTLSLDLGPSNGSQVSARLYGGGTYYVRSAIPPATHPDARGGIELRFGVSEPTGAPAPQPAASPFLSGSKQFGVGHGGLGAQDPSASARGPHGRALRRGARSYVLAYEALIQRQYAHDPAAPGQPVFVVGTGHWVTHHAMAMLVFNLDTLRSTSNALALSIEYIHGRNQRGQLTEYDEVNAGAVGLSYYW
jgi:hypothetical protein